MERVVQGFEVAGVAILVVGSLLAFVSAGIGLGRGGGRGAHPRGARGGAGERGCSSLWQRRRPRADRAGPNVPPLLPGGRAGRPAAVASRLDGETAGPSGQRRRRTRM